MTPLRLGRPQVHEADRVDAHRAQRTKSRRCGGARGHGRPLPTPRAATSRRRGPGRYANQSVTSTLDQSAKMHFSSVPDVADSEHSFRDVMQNGRTALPCSRLAGPDFPEGHEAVFVLIEKPRLLPESANNRPAICNETFRSFQLIDYLARIALTLLHFYMDDEIVRLRIGDDNVVGTLALSPSTRKNSLWRRETCPF